MFLLFLFHVTVVIASYSFSEWRLYDEGNPSLHSEPILTVPSRRQNLDLVLAKYPLASIIRERGLTFRRSDVLETAEAISVEVDPLNAAAIFMKLAFRLNREIRPTLDILSPCHVLVATPQGDRVVISLWFREIPERFRSSVQKSLFEAVKL